MSHLNGPVSAVEIAAQLRKGSLCPVELVEQTIDAIRSSDPAIFTELLEERAVAEARASRERLRTDCALSRWDGVPIAWEGFIRYKGEGYHCGLRFDAWGSESRKRFYRCAVCISGGACFDRMLEYDRVCLFRHWS